MNLSVCTISLRHSLISLRQVGEWAACHQFSGIELWGVHAMNLKNHLDDEIPWLQQRGLGISMLSDYLPLQKSRQVMVDKMHGLCRLAQACATNKIRTFAGDKGSHEISSEERQDWTVRLHHLCEIARDYGLDLVIETHPQTLADTKESTIQLIGEVNHPSLRLNFDVLHVWESGEDPFTFIKEIEPLVAHMHLKNVRAKSFLQEFFPGNVYAPSGSREGMVQLFEGVFDYDRFLPFVMTDTSLWPMLDVSLEWFGPDVFTTLEKDAKALFSLEENLLGLVTQPQSATTI